MFYKNQRNEVSVAHSANAKDGFRCIFENNLGRLKVVWVEAKPKDKTLGCRAPLR